MDKCCCSTKSRLIYSCSGAANTGEIADQIARKLAKEGSGSMTCLVSVGAHISGFVQSAKGAEENTPLMAASLLVLRKSLNI